MNKEIYFVKENDRKDWYWFKSIGPKGIILKAINFIELSKNYYHLAFGDWDDKLERINDQTRTNNGDRNKVLSTVAHAVMKFMDYYPNATVYAKGSSPSRTRLYQIGIMNNWAEINDRYSVQGYRNGFWAPFEPG